MWEIAKNTKDAAAEFDRTMVFVKAAQHGQSGRLGGAIARHHGLHCPHLKAWDWPPDS